MDTNSGSITVLASTPTTVDEATLFSFDDASIPFTENLKLSMETPRKYPGNPVMSRGDEGKPDVFGVQFYGFRLWLLCFVFCGRRL